MDKDQAIELLEKNAKEWIAFALRNPDEAGNPQGFGEDIVDIMPEPSEENNWLYNEEEGTISGELVDANDRRYEFELSEQADGDWNSVVKPILSEQEAEEAAADEDLEEEAPIEDQVVENNEHSDEPSDEVEMMKQELEFMKKQLKKYEEEKQMAAKSEIANFCERLYEDRQLTDEQIKKEYLLDMLYSIHDTCNTMESVMAYSEGETKVTVIDGIKKLLKALPKQVNFSEGTTVKEKKAPKAIKFKDDKSFSQDSNKMDAKVREYMKEYGMDNTPLNYRKAYRELLK